jgi:1-acyl-sn-glycerol-3-phosphate acyltransferase
MAEQGPATPLATQARDGPGGPLSRRLLLATLAAFFESHGPVVAADVTQIVEREIDAAGPAALRDLDRHLRAAGADWTYYPSDPLSRRVHHAIAARLLPPASGVRGAHHLQTIGADPVVLVSNHLSYSDANLIEVLLHAHGGAAVAARLTAMAGPKVYSSRRRTFSSLCFGAIKTPQNSAVSSGEAAMGAREVATLARRVIGIARERLRAGDALLLFAEGRRSRTGALEPLLPGAARYFDDADLWVVPMGITGTEAMFPVDDNTLHLVPITVSAGAPIHAARLRTAAGGDRRLMMDIVGLAIAELLPPAYRGVYRDDQPGLDEARAARLQVGGGPVRPGN